MNESIRAAITQLEREHPGYQVWCVPTWDGHRHSTLFCARRWDGTSGSISADSPEHLAEYIAERETGA